MRILIIEDEMALAQSVRRILLGEGYSCDIAQDGKLGLALGISEHYDVILLDIMLPKTDGLTVLKKLRQAEVFSPVIITSAKAETKDKVQGLDLGANYYLTKPFEAEELIACIRAVTRGNSFSGLNDIIFGKTLLSTSFMAISNGGKTIKLAEKEFLIFRLLIKAQGGIVENDAIAKALWGESAETQKNKIDVYISVLRKKLAFINSDITIQTIRKKGYFLEISC